MSRSMAARICLTSRSKPPPQPPPAPEVVADTRTSVGVTLKWSASTDDGGQLISGYRLYRDDGSTGVPNIIIWNGENSPNVLDI